MATRFRGNYKGLGELLASEAMVAEMIRRAEQAKTYAEGIAPRRTDHFAGSFYVVATRHGGVKKDRARASLGNDDPAAPAIELGTGKTPPHRTLRRAATEGMGD